MKKFLCFCSVIASVLVLSSCTKSEVEADEYFVRYVSDGLSGAYNATYSDETGNAISLSSIDGETFERTIGPVKEGYIANFSIYRHLNGKSASVRIEVKKNNAPFVVKKEGTNGVRYTIE